MAPDVAQRADSSDSSDVVVQLRSVTVAFGGLVALGDVDLDVTQGQRLAILGPNGAGKTTLFNVVAGDLSPEALHPALGGLTLDLPYGDISLDENRSGIVDVGLSQLVEKDGEVVQEAVAIIPEVDQTFGGTFSTDTPPPGRDFPDCEEADLPWVGNAIPVTGGVPQN